MKMKLYYVVEKAKGRYDEHDVDYIAGPFTFDAVYDYKSIQERSYDYEVVEQIIDVE